LHIAHLSTGGSVQLIREAKERYGGISCETNPHYFLLTEEAVQDYNTYAKVNPPLRTDADVELIIKGIVDKTIDVIASGHSPTGRSDKDKEFDCAVYGISALETAFSLSYTRLVETGLITIEELVCLMSEKPAEILKLYNKGRIAVGKDADLIVVDTEKWFHVDPAHFASKAQFSPFANKRVKGSVLFTMVGGKLV